MCENRRGDFLTQTVGLLLVLNCYCYHAVWPHFLAYPVYLKEGYMANGAFSH